MISDPLNTFETEIVNLLKGGGSYPENDITEVSDDYIHEKIREDIRNYKSYELPNIGVLSLRYIEGDDKIDDIEMMLQYMDMGADLAAMDTKAKTVAGKIINILKMQSPYYKDGLCLQGNAKDIYDIDNQMLYGTLAAEGEMRGSIVVISQTTFKITIIAK